MDLKGILIGAVVLCLVMFTSLNYMSGMSSAYNQTLDTHGYFNDSTQKLDNLTKQTNETYHNLRDVNFEESNFLYASFDLLKASWSALTVVFKSMDIFFSMVEDVFTTLNQELGIPPIVLGVIVAIIIILIIVMLIEAYFRWKISS